MLVSSSSSSANKASACAAVVIGPIGAGGDGSINRSAGGSPGGGLAAIRAARFTSPKDFVSISSGIEKSLPFNLRFAIPASMR